MSGTVRGHQGEIIQDAEVSGREESVMTQISSEERAELVRLVELFMSGQGTEGDRLRRCAIWRAASCIRECLT